MILTPTPTFPDSFNMAHYFLDARVEEGRGDHVAVIDDHGQYTYRQVQALANQVGNALAAMGVGVEDRVLIGLSDSVEFAATFFGVLKIGAVVAMVNPELPEGDYPHYLDYTRARALVCDRALADRVRPLLDAAKLLRGVITAGGNWSETVGRASASLTNFPTSQDDPSVWLFTSGSTGKPKGAVHLHRDFAYNTECYAKQVLKMRPEDVTLGVPKLFFGYATGTNLMFPFAVGATTVLFAERATPENLFERSARHGATVLTSVPTMINKMVQTAGGPRSLTPLRVCISAGEALPPELYHRWKESFDVEILDGIGSAELFHIYISNRLGEVRPGSLGRLVPGYEAKIVGADGNVVPDGEVGTLWAKGDSAAVCYWQARDKSKEVFRGEWVVSGDLFRRDGEGFFYYAGRADDMLKVGGIWVSPMEVESCLLRHPHVLETAVIGYEDDDGLVKPLAYVVAKGVAASETLAAEIIEHCKRELAHYKAPRKVQFVEALPRSDRGKILRRELRS
ncbi:MAG: Benzoate-CoA ligase [Myxococcales bacterium]|nr:Benzoate-CoA ligase [Myxococcales bacterium]